MFDVTSAPASRMEISVVPLRIRRMGNVSYTEQRVSRSLRAQTQRPSLGPRALTWFLKRALAEVSHTNWRELAEWLRRLS